MTRQVKICDRASAEENQHVRQLHLTVLVNRVLYNTNTSFFPQLTFLTTQLIQPPIHERDRINDERVGQVLKTIDCEVHGESIQSHYLPTVVVMLLLMNCTHE